MPKSLSRIRAGSKSEGWDWKYWVRSEQDERALLDGCRPDPAAGKHVCQFFEQFLVHSKGEWAGKPFVLLAWQRDQVVMPLFGWKRADGRRRYRRAGIWVAKKNGKSTLAAGIAMYLLVADDEPGAEVYCAAADREQASIVFREAAAMVEASPTLKRRLHVVRTTKTIAYEARSARYKSLSADVPTKEGLNIHGLIFDELHAQRTRDLWDALVYGGAARRQPLFISISTAGYDRHSIGYEQYQYAKSVAEGTIVDTAFMAYVAETGEADDWNLKKNWKRANPSWGVTIKPDGFEHDYREAKNSPTKENSFRRYRLNQWTEQAIRWLPLEAWDACAGEVDADALEGRECFMGLDLAATRDTTALVAVFPGEDGSYSVMPFFFIPDENARERERRDGVPYVTWARQGFIDFTPGNVTDYGFIRAKIVELGKRYKIREIAFDPWNATQFVNDLVERDGFDIKRMVAHRQGFVSMSEPSKALERLVLSEKIRHGGHPVLRHQASCVSVKLDPAGNIKPDKTKSTHRIDGIVATIMALSRTLLTVEKKSHYDEDKLLVL